MRDYLRDDISEIWIDSEHAYNEAAHFISEKMPSQMSKLRKYIDFEPMFVRFGIERQIESAYQREVRLPSGGSIVIDQTEAMVAIDINSAKSTKGSDVAETAFHTNLEAADEIARQLRLRDMGGLIVIDFIDMAETRHQKEVEKRLIEATRHDRARVQFDEISKFGLLEMSRQRLRPSLDETTGYICPRCHGNGMVRDVRSLALSIMRAIEQLALKHRCGEVQAEVPTEIAAFLLNEKRESLVYLEQDSGTRITVLPHAHLESPNYSLHFNPDGFAPATYDRVVDVEEQLNVNRGYEVDWQTKPTETTTTNHWQKGDKKPEPKPKEQKPANDTTKPQAVAWLSNLFAPKEQAKLAHGFDSSDAASAIEAIVNGGGVSLGASGALQSLGLTEKINKPHDEKTYHKPNDRTQKNDKSARPVIKKDEKAKEDNKVAHKVQPNNKPKVDNKPLPKREPGSTRESRPAIERGEPLNKEITLKSTEKPQEQTINKSSNNDKPKADKKDNPQSTNNDNTKKIKPTTKSDEFAIYAQKTSKETPIRTVHLSLDGTPKSASQTKILQENTLAEITQTAKEQEPKIAEQSPINTHNLSELSDLVTDETTTQQTIAQPSDTVVEPVAQHQEEFIAQAGAEDDKTQNPTHATQHTLTVNVANFEQNPVLDDRALIDTAISQNRPKNDPRVVIAAFESTQNKPNKNSNLIGTAGSFIRKTLADADMLLQEQGFVACFIKALSVHHNTQSQAGTNLSFANYGYLPLSDELKADFAQKITPKGKFDTTQGKTTPPARTPTPRASNDPRGEYIEIQESAITEETSEHLNVQAVDAHTLVSPEKVNEIVHHDTPKNLDLLESTEQLVSELLDNVQELLHLTDHKKTGSKKTPQANYRNMIENIAEQLLPPTGILKLATPKKATKKPAVKKTTKVAIKIPKADTKPKTEIVKRKKTPSENDGNPNDNTND